MTREQFIHACYASGLCLPMTAEKYCDENPKAEYDEAEFSKIPLSHHWGNCADDRWKKPYKIGDGGKTTAINHVGGNANGNTDWT